MTPGLNLTKEELQNSSYVPDLLGLLEDEVKNSDLDNSQILFEMIKNISEAVRQLNSVRESELVNRELQESMQESAEEISSSLELMSKEVGKADPGVEKLSKALLAQADQMKAMIGKLTTPDTSAVEKVLADNLAALNKESKSSTTQHGKVLETIAKLMGVLEKKTNSDDLSKITEAIKESKPKEWEFTVERSKNTDRIVKIKAKAV